MLKRLTRLKQFTAGLSQKIILLMVVLVVAVIGTSLLVTSQASTPVTSLYAAQGSTAGNTCTVADTSAANGKAAVSFGSACSAVNSSLLAQQKQLVVLGLDQILCLNQPATSSCVNNYQDGELVPSLYNTSSWSVYGTAVASIATLSVQPDGTAAQRTMAIDILNTAIATHQQPAGYFDKGTPTSGSAGVGGGMWAMSEGYTALLLRNHVSSAQLKQWEQSMALYADYLKTNKDLSFYANGNVVLHHTIVLLETYKLAVLVGDPEATIYLQEYQTAKQFLTNPSASSPDPSSPYWVGYGKRTTANGGFYFSESIASGYLQPLVCDSGMNPCDGFDPEYTMLQMDNMTVGLAVASIDTGDTLDVQTETHYWLDTINGAYKAELPRIGQAKTVDGCPAVTTGILNAAHGSRKNHPCDMFEPPIFYNLEANHQGDYDTLWSIQLQLYKPNIQNGIIASTPSLTAYRYLMFLSAALATPANL